jgi:hypothetical protein
MFDNFSKGIEMAVGLAFELKDLEVPELEFSDDYIPGLRSDDTVAEDQPRVADAIAERGASVVH